MNAQVEALLEAAPPGSEDLTTPTLAGVLARLDLLLKQAVEGAAEKFGAPPTADPFRGMYVSDADAARVVERGIEPLGRELSFEPPLVNLHAAGPSWRWLANVFGLSPAEVDVVALALAADVDLRYERVFGYLHDDVTRRRPTVDLALQLLCQSFEERLAGRQMFAPNAPLVRCGLLRLVPDPVHPDPPMIGHALRLEEDVVHFLLERTDFDRRLAGACRWEPPAPAQDLSPAARSVADRLGQRLEHTGAGDSPLHFLLAGPNEREKLDITRQVARQLQVPLLVIDLGRLALSEMPFPSAMLLAARTARLQNALPMWTRGDAIDLGPAGPGESRLDVWLGALEAMNMTTGLLATPERHPKWTASASHRFMRLDFPLPDSRVRGAIWDDRLGSLGVELDKGDALLLAEAFRFDAGAIDRAADRALTTARWRNDDDPRVDRADLIAGARAEAFRVLPRYATHLDAAYGWDDIVLPADQLRQLRELCERVRHRRTVLEDWGFASRLPLGTGVAALFAGPSGTGKTMAAQLIAAALGGLELYRVEIPAIVSKYIGETEKALDQVFREAQGTSAILFFDEADALFGRRTEIKDAHDRYANIEVAYLLQALEAYEGLTILATNFRHNMDEAFVRRLAFIVSFPYPEQPERRRLWTRGWPPATPLGDDVDIDFLARQFKLTGGDIRNAALSAAFAAAADGGRVTMAHVIRGVRREYQKMGKVCAESDFGPYFGLLAS